MPLGAAHAERRQDFRGRRGRAAARKRTHLRDREVQRAEARRRLRNPYYYIAERSGAWHIASGAPRAPIIEKPRSKKIRGVQNVVGPTHAQHPRASKGEKRRQLRRPQ